MLEDFGRFAMGLDKHVGVIRAQKGIGPGHCFGGINHHPHQIRAVEIAQHAMDKIFVPVQQHRRAGSLGGGLDALPLAQQGLEIINQQLFADGLSLGADQQPSPWGLDQHTKGPEAIALVIAINAAGDIDTLAVGLEHQKAPRQSQIASEAGALGAGGLLHHLHEHLLARLQQLGDAGRTLAQPQGAQIGDMDEAVFLAFADVYKGGIDTGQDVFNGAEIDISDLVAALGYYQFIYPFIVENRGDPQLLGNDDLLGHGVRNLAHLGLPRDRKTEGSFSCSANKLDNKNSWL